MEIVTIYTVTDYKSGKRYEEAIIGDGQGAAKTVRSMYPRHTKFVLEGFEIDGTYVPLYIKNKYND
jgi:hypothetical protein